MAAEGDSIVVCVHITARGNGRGAGSDVPAEDILWLVHRWRGGKCIWTRTFNSRDAALEAAGLSEQDAHADS